MTYRWTVAGKQVGTGRTYTPSASTVGKSLALTVTGSKAGFVTRSAVSPAVKVARGTLKSASPAIKGKAKVGKRLVVKRGSWTAGTKVTYRWYVNGKAVRGATKSAFRLTTKHRGKRVTVRVTGKKPGYATVIRTSKKTAKVKR